MIISCCFVLWIAILTSSVYANYPKKSLQCYSTYTKPDMKLICPEARNEYCVKETVNLEVSLCGATQYFGDIYSSGVCLMRKCSDVCEEGTYDFDYSGATYQRTRYCCGSDFCNSSSTIFRGSVMMMIICIVILILCL